MMFRTLSPTYSYVKEHRTMQEARTSRTICMNKSYVNFMGLVLEIWY